MYHYDQDHIISLIISWDLYCPAEVAAEAFLEECVLCKRLGPSYCGLLTHAVDALPAGPAVSGLPGTVDRS